MWTLIFTAALFIIRKLKITYKSYNKKIMVLHKILYCVATKNYISEEYFITWGKRSCRSERKRKKRVCVCVRLCVCVYLHVLPRKREERGKKREEGERERTRERGEMSQSYSLVRFLFLYLCVFFATVIYLFCYKF